jgi:hypothetical protein
VSGNQNFTMEYIDEDLHIVCAEALFQTLGRTVSSKSFFSSAPGAEPTILLVAQPAMWEAIEQRAAA